MFDYYAWRLKKWLDHFPRRINPFKEILYFVKNKIVYPATHIGLPKYYWWSAIEPIGEMVLKSTWHLQKEPLGYPGSFVDIPDEEGVKEWKRIIFKIRKAFFYQLYDTEIYFNACYAKDIKELSFMYRRHLSRYPYVRGLLSWKMMKYFMASGLEEAKNYIKKDYGNSVFGNEPFRGTVYCKWEESEEFAKVVEEGMDLFKKYFRNLWS